MFPVANFEPATARWVDAIETSIEDAEKAQPGLDSELNGLQRESNGVLNQVTSRVNAYYTNTLLQYPAFQRTVPMQDVLGGVSKVVSISAPASADSTVAETWVSIFTHDITMPAADTVVGIRLNGAMFGLKGPSTYSLRFRWRVNGSIEGIGTTRWLSRHQFNLSSFGMDPTNPVLTTVRNRYVHWTGASTSTLSLELQASIYNPSSIASAVASQNITFYARDNDDRQTYLDVMVTV